MVKQRSEDSVDNNNNNNRRQSHRPGPAVIRNI